MAVSFFNIFTKKRIRLLHPDAPQFYTAHSGDTFSPGAESFAFQPKFANLIVPPFGTGIVVGSLQTLQPRPIVQHLALATNPYQGTPVGSFALQGLIDNSQIFGDAQ